MRGICMSGLTSGDWKRSRGSISRFGHRASRQLYCWCPAANLGIPTVIDRVIQQAVLQRLQPLWDPTFSEHSYGFRPWCLLRSCESRIRVTSGGAGASLCHRRLSVRRRYRFGEIFRPS